MAERRIAESIVAINFEHLACFSSRWENIEVAAALIYHYYSLKISKAEKMESQKDFESKVTEFTHRLSPKPGNVEDLLTAANIQNQDDETLAVFHAAG